MNKAARAPPLQGKEEERALDFEVKAPTRAEGKIRLSAYGLYHVCDDASGQCRFLRLDLPINQHVTE